MKIQRNARARKGAVQKPESYVENRLPEEEDNENMETYTQGQLESTKSEIWQKPMSWRA